MDFADTRLLRHRVSWDFICKKQGVPFYSGYAFFIWIRDLLLGIHVLGSFLRLAYPVGQAGVFQKEQGPLPELF